MTLPSSLGDLYKACRDILNNDLEARRILEDRGGFEWAELLANPEKPVSADILKAIQSDLDRRLAGEPLSRIHGERQFYGLDFIVTPATLDPRADTEVLIDAVLEFYGDAPPQTFLDLGTGTGCIAITLLNQWKNARAVAVDVSREAIDIARRNALRHNVLDRMALVCGSWGEGVDEKFDLIVSNPPYIAESVIPELEPEVRNHDPILALSGGEDGLEAYKIIFSDLNRLLNPGGSGFFEIGYDQGDSIMRLVEESGLFLSRIHRDLAENQRVAQIQMGISKK